MGSALKMKGLLRRHTLRKPANVGIEPVKEDTPNDDLQKLDTNWLEADNADVSVSGPFTAFIFPPQT